MCGPDVDCKLKWDFFFEFLLLLISSNDEKAKNEQCTYAKSIKISRTMHRLTIMGDQLLALGRDTARKSFSSVKSSPSFAAWNFLALFFQRYLYFNNGQRFLRHTFFYRLFGLEIFIEN
jgi:hypothetical protein